MNYRKMQPLRYLVASGIATALLASSLSAQPLEKMRLAIGIRGSTITFGNGQAPGVFSQNALDLEVVYRKQRVVT